jgi:hypothetical protein
VVRPTVRLGKVPVIKLDAQPPVSEEDAAKIRRLIASLAEIDSPDFGLSPTMTGHSFAPIAGAHHASTFLLTPHGLKPSAAVRELVHHGPRALPFLLDALTDKTHTRLTIRHTEYLGGMWFDREIWGNPINATEQRVIASAPKARLGGLDGEHLKQYTVQVGDACFVAIGQIVGRPYRAVRYQPTMIIIVNSPTRDATLARQVRDIWSNDIPSQHLMDSLLADYSTQGIFNGRSLDGWDVGNALQTAAAMRLLYYFPRQSVPMIAERLRRLKVHATSRPGRMPTQAESDASMKRAVDNGVRADEFIKAVAWCKEPVIREEVLRLFQRTLDPNILAACLPGIGAEHTSLVCARLEAFLNLLPPDEQGPYGDGYNVLAALGQHLGEEGKRTFKHYLRRNSVQRCYSTCLVLRQTRGGWAIELLTPLLTDQRPTGRTYPVVPGKEESRLPIRVCDEAAQTISLHHPEIPFRMAGTHKDLDEQIAAMREQIARRA